MVNTFASFFTYHGRCLTKLEKHFCHGIVMALEFIIGDSSKTFLRTRIIFKLMALRNRSSAGSYMML